MADDQLIVHLGLQGWTEEEADVFRRALQRFGVGQWKDIIDSGCLPGKTNAQMNIQLQRMLGQQSVAGKSGTRSGLPSLTPFPRDVSASRIPRLAYRRSRHRTHQCSQAGARHRAQERLHRKQRGSVPIVSCTCFGRSHLARFTPTLSFRTHGTLNMLSMLRQVVAGRDQESAGREQGKVSYLHPDHRIH